MIERRFSWLLALVVGCGGYRPARFVDRPVATAAGDEQLIEIPKKRRHLPELYWIETYTAGSIVSSLSLGRPPVGADVNRLDEVVRSSWFRGPADGDLLADYTRDGPPRPPLVSLDHAPPLDVDGSEMVEDARGLSYQLVFDIDGAPETRTAAMAIASRLVHALGYHTAEAHVIDVDGRRATAVRIPIARDLGPTPMLWTRGDDPNDVLPHADRRSLRALGLVAAWLGVHTIPEHMLRDVFVGSARRGFVRHVVAGLEGALGTGLLHESRRDAADPQGDDTPGWKLLLTLGAYPKPDEAPPVHSGLRGVGLYAPQVHAEQDVVEPLFPPLERARPDDHFWIAQRMASLHDATIERAIAAGRLRDAASRRYLKNALLLRRRSVFEGAASLVTPCEVLAVRDGRDATRVLLIDRESQWLADDGLRVYRIVASDLDGEPLAAPREVASYRNWFSVPVEDAWFDGRKVIVLRVFKLSGIPRERSLDVHLLRDAGATRLFGVER